MPDDYAREAAKEEWIQARCEAKILGSFFRYADAQGLPMPEITSSIRQALQISGTSDTHFNRVVQTASRWPPDELLPLAGQAQHYGLPTRLLDWSRDPWVAAYFAAKSGMESLKSDGSLNVDTSSIAVWILNADLLDHEKRLARPQEPMDIPLTLVTAPAGTNPNLRAQHGMFTVWRPLFINRAKQQVDRRPLEVLLSEAFIGKEPTLPLLYKFMLPLNQVSDLWKIIRRNIVNAARMFPDFSGAAEAVREDSKYK